MPAPKDPVAYALWKERMSEARQGEKNGMFGKHLTEEHKHILSVSMKGKYAGEKNPMYGVRLTGELNPNFGKSLSDEHRQKLSQAMAGKPAWNRGLPSPQKGIPRSNETKEKISKANKGRHLGKSSWNKGKNFSDESKQKMSEAKTGKTMPDVFKQKRSEIMKEQWKNPEFKEDMSIKHSGENNPNFGKELSEEQKQKLSTWAKERTDNPIETMRQANLGRPLTNEHRTKLSETHAGDKCYNWKGGITPVYKHIRGRLEYKHWCQELLKKHDYTDAFTGHKGGLLSCHHIIPVNMLIKMYNITDIEGALACPLIWDLNNGLVILKYAHDKFHNLYGDDKNIYELTPDQIKELYL